MKNKLIRLFVFISLIACVGFISSAQATITAFGTQEAPDVSILINGTSPVVGDPISSTPTIQITATTSNSVQSGSINVGAGPTSLTFVQVSNNFYATHEVTTALSAGTHGITIEVTDNYSNTRTYELYPLYVQSAADLTIQGIPLNNPNPFDPGSETTTIGYTLSKPANITLSFFDLAGNLIARNSYAANQEGGKAGYNAVTWDGRSSSGSFVGNGIYLYLIIADGKVAQNGKGKLTVFKR